MICDTCIGEGPCVPGVGCIRGYVYLSGNECVGYHKKPYLLPCAHCGGKARTYTKIGKTFRYVLCDSCGARTDMHNTGNEARSAWNRRDKQCT